MIDGLPKPLRHAVAQTIAAERLEGWEPSEENVTALAALATEQTSFAEYLATFRGRYPPPVREGRGLAWPKRRVPYYIPGTTLLRNNFGAVSADVLGDLEYVATAGRMVQWFRDSAAPAPPVSVRDIHRHVFGDVYSWAGEYRITELLRGDQGFAWRRSIADAMSELHDRVLTLAADGVSHDNARLSWELSRIYADYNQIHPFREGNGRTGAVLLHDIAACAGRRLDMTSISRADWYSAARDSMPFHRDGRASHRPFLPLLLHAVVAV